MAAAVAVTSARLLVNDHAVDGAMRTMTGVIDRDRMTRTKAVVIDRRAVIVHEWHVAAVAEALLAAANADADVIGAPAAPGSVQMVRKSRDRQEDRRDKQSKKDLFH